MDIVETSEDGERAWLSFRIQDNGAGMSREFVEHSLYKPFTQENDNIRTNYQGTGLGMAIVHEMTDAMGGTIQVESELGKGTVFTVFLPFGIGREPEKELETEAKQKEGAQLEEQYDNAIKEAVKKNITNPVGVFLFKQTFYNNSTAENTELLEQIPANFQNDEAIVRIKDLTDKQKKTAVGTKFIDFEMKTPDGKPVKLSDYVGKGKVVLVDFWASWCGPCRREIPNLVETYAKYKGKNFEIVGVSLDQDDAAWKDAIKKLNMTWPQMSDLKFWQSEGAQLYAVNSIPHTVLIDGEGTIIARGLHGEELQAKIAEVVK